MATNTEMKKKIRVKHQRGETAGINHQIPPFHCGVYIPFIWCDRIGGKKVVCTLMGVLKGSFVWWRCFRLLGINQGLSKEATLPLGAKCSFLPLSLSFQRVLIPVGLPGCCAHTQIHGCQTDFDGFIKAEFSCPEAHFRLPYFSLLTYVSAGILAHCALWSFCGISKRFVVAFEVALFVCTQVRLFETSFWACT